MWYVNGKDPYHRLGPPALVEMQCGTDGTAISNSYSELEKHPIMPPPTKSDLKNAVPSVRYTEVQSICLQLNLLGKLRRQSGGYVSQCPACAEAGLDRQGNHLIICDDGRYACVCHPGRSGSMHRKRIFQLVGNKHLTSKPIPFVQISLL